MRREIWIFQHVGMILTAYSTDDISRERNKCVIETNHSPGPLQRLKSTIEQANYLV
jgi:hypothetical protein